MVDQPRTAPRSALSHTDAFATSSADALMLVGRVMIGWLFLKAGWDKFMNMEGFAGYLTRLGVPAPELMAWPAATAEVLIGLTLILGFAARYAALACFVYLIIATLLAHRYWTYPPEQQLNQFNHMLKNIAIMGGALYIFVTGAGRYSTDRVLTRRS
jgi:putative oxidoreductase